MSSPVCYFSLVRYMPNLSRGEVLNVGIVLCCPERQCVVVKTLTDFKQRPLPSVFPSADTRFLKHRLAELRTLLHHPSSSGSQIMRGLFSLTGGTVPESEQFGPAVIRLLQATHCNDIQFGELEKASGEPQVVSEVLFRALVDVPRHSTDYPSREVIRRGFRQRLKDERLLSRVQEEVWLGLPELEERVDFTYTNGSLHCLQAISLAAPDARGLVQRFRQLARDLRESAKQPGATDPEFFALLHIPHSPGAVVMKRALEADRILPVDWQDTDQLIMKINADLRPHFAN